MRSLKILTASITALALASCGGGDTGEAPKGEPVAAVAAPAGKQWIDVVSKTAEGGYLIGNPDAKIKLVEYASLTCHVCAQFAKDSGADLHDNFINNGKISYEFRNFVRDEFDLMAARVTRCGANEAMLPLTEQFMDFQETLFENANKIGTDKALEAKISSLKGGERFFALADAVGIIEFFAQRGVSRDQSRACMSDTAEMQKLADLTAEYGKKYTIQGTPTFYLNGARLDVTAWAQVKGKLQEAGAR
ncbi:MAG: thioredoxin domain-containing protein [Sphingomonadales bacterium]|jgi:protein-disulfide isomerase|nr:thioredoxin domain-containing protein [Sphingomonadales bacterium]MBK9005143.1 thioredoxin domain-containing protein [Sphingomonadales bacterium]MBK9267123.1 thioredoxin domain-containing protein [Sphingomonadales bacterium]MBP6433072.1 thioredoxin domain-containing protein [Sphingorhabdus sp.]